MVRVPKTATFLCVTKKEVIQEAATKKIEYYITDKIFILRRDVMVIT